MNTKDNTECGIVQLQIDNLLDNELQPGEQQPVLAHIRACPDCGREYLLARAMSDALLDLPRPELPPELLARVYEQTARERVSLAGRLRQFAARALPAPAWRLAVPAFAVVAAVAVWLQFSATEPQFAPPQQISQAPQVLQPIDTEQYSREELVVAIEDLNTTIQTLNEITESMRTRLGDRMVSLPLLSLPALSIDSVDSGAAASSANNPI